MKHRSPDVLPDTIRARLFWGEDSGRALQAARTTRSRWLGHDSAPGSTGSAGSADPSRSEMAYWRLDPEELLLHEDRLFEILQQESLIQARQVVEILPARDLAQERRLTGLLREALELEFAPGVLLLVRSVLAQTRSPLQQLFALHKRATSVVFYAQSDFRARLRQRLNAAHFTIEPEAETWLEQSIGTDTEQADAEIEKLILYIDTLPRGRSITLSDVIKGTQADAPVRLDHLVDVALAGESFGRLRDSFQAVWQSGMAPELVVRAALQHAMELASMQKGLAAGEGLERVTSHVFFKRRDMIRRHLQLWRGPALDTLVERLGRLEHQMRCHPALRHVLAERCFLSLAMDGRNAGRALMKSRQFSGRPSGRRFSASS